MVQSNVPLETRIDVVAAAAVDDDHHNEQEEEVAELHDDKTSLEQELARSLSNFVIPRPSLVVSSSTTTASKASTTTATTSSTANVWESSPPSRGSTASSTQSAASGTLLLTAANLANLAKLHPPTLMEPTIKQQQQQQLDAVSVASSTHFTVVNGLGRPSVVKKKSWCARNQLTVLVCSTSLLFMLGLLLGVLYMDMRVRTKYN